jgi:uncharacterized protein (TIGR02246 family)
MTWSLRLLAAVAFLAVAGCVPQFMQQPPQQTPIAYGPATEHQVEQALQRYSGLIASMDAPAIADMYTPDGVWERQSGALQGREAIRQAVSSAAARILTNEMTTTYMSYNGPAVVQTGDFKQSARLPDGKVVSAAGKFEATWVRGPNGEWWILRMVTRPAK